MHSQQSGKKHPEWAGARSPTSSRINMNARAGQARSKEREKSVFGEQVRFIYDTIGTSGIGNSLLVNSSNR
jgi:hypothetical protein